MKRILLFTYLINTFLLSKAQEVPVIHAEVSKIEITDEKLRDSEKAEKILKKVWENDYDYTILDENEKKFLENFKNKYKEINLEDGEMVWSVHGIGCSWYCGAMYEVAASSELPPSGNNDYSVSKLSDDDIRTAWVEGAEGYGIGEHISFTFPYTAPRATHVILVNGYAKNEQTWKNNSRVKTFNVYDNENLIAIVHLQDTRNTQWFALPYPFPKRPDNFEYGNNEDYEKTVELSFFIAEVYKGDKYADTAISEILFDGIDVHCLSGETKITMDDYSTKELKDIQAEDRILSYSPNSTNHSTAIVKFVRYAVHDKVLKLIFDDGRHIITTPDHPFLTESGWTSYIPQKTKYYRRYATIPVIQYQEGSSFTVINKDGFHKTVRLIRIEEINNQTNTYTLELDNPNAAFIANGLCAGQE